MKELPSPQNIIVRMPNWIGDFVMAIPVLIDLRNSFKDARITAMCRAPLGELLKEDSVVDEIFSFTKASGFARRVGPRNVIEKLREGQYDLGVLLTNSFSSAWLFWQGRVKNRLGFQGHWRRMLLTRSMPFPQNVKEQHLVTTYKMLLAFLGIPVSATSPRLILTEEERLEARKLLENYGVPKHHVIVGINPGATYGSAKCWLPERFREVTERLLGHEDISIIYFGDPGSALLVKEICRGFSSRVVNLAGMTSLRELACLISVCDALLTNDSGPMHIADALEIPLVALFGSTNEVVTGPYSSQNVIHKHVSCSPCHRRVCPIDFRCMKEIQAEEVYQELCRILKTKSSKLKLC
jgi:heptosyltransferase-2